MSGLSTTVDANSSSGRPLQAEPLLGLCNLLANDWRVLLRGGFDAGVPNSLSNTESSRAGEPSTRDETTAFFAFGVAISEYFL